MSGADAVVCNTGPLIALGLLGRLNRLQTFYQRVVVPETVQREIFQGGTMRPGRVELSVEWIEVLPAMSDPVLAAMLDPGEAAVRVLARSLGISHVLMDERKGRKIARTILGLTVSGTARLLVDAARAGLIVSARRELETLRAGGYWLGDNILAWAEAMEKRQ